MLRYVWDVSHAYFFEAALLIVLQVVSNVLFILIGKLVLDILTGEGSLVSIAIYCGVLLIVNVVQQWYSSWYYMKKTRYVTLQVQEAMQNRMFQKAVELDVGCYESGAFYDCYVKAAPEADGRAMAIFNTLFEFLRNVLNILSVFVIIFTLDFVMIFFTIASIGVSLLFTNLKNKHIFKFDQEEKDINRQREYVKRVFYLPAYAKELKLFPITGKLREKYTNETRRLYAATKRHFSKIFTYDFATGGALACISIGMIFYLCFRVYTGRITVGDFVALDKSTGTLTGSLRGVFSIITELKRHSLYVDNYLAFMNYSPRIRPDPSKPALPAERPIHFSLQHVDFQYEQDSTFALRDINLEIQSGERIAVVGYNGAGKTTLVKLLLRLYDVTRGTIYVNGADIRTYDVQSLWRHIGVVFQDSQYYALPIRDNIVPEGRECEDAAVEEALQKANLLDKISRLPQGIHTPVSKELSTDGEVFSGGQLQSLFLARVFLQDAQTLILDEPSSALDPIAEDKILSAMLELVKQKTVVIIAHRLSCVKFVDRIVFMENGEICEQGTHEELMRLQGKYAHMYQTQAKHYFKMENEETSAPI